MRATRSGIVIGLALALLVPGSVAGQEASPSAEPSAEPSPLVESSAEPAASPLASCLPEANPVVAEYEALVAELAAGTASANEDWRKAKGGKAVVAGIDRLTDVSNSFYDGVKALDISPETQASLDPHLDKLATEYGRTWAELSAGSIALDEKVEFPKTEKSVVAIRSVLGQLDPCAVPVLVEASPEPTAEASAAGRTTDFYVVAQSIDSVLGNKVDKKATFAKVKRILDSMYENGEYRPYLRTLASPQVPDMQLGKRVVLGVFDKCRTEKEVFNRVIYCPGSVNAMLSYASQYAPDSADPSEAAINAVFLRAVNLLRSAAANDGVPLKQMDRSLRDERDYHLSEYGPSE